MKKDSILHTLDPRSKMFFTLIIVILSISIPVPLYLSFFLIIVVMTALVGGALKELLAYLSPLKILVPILLILNLFFYAQGKPIWSVDLRILTLSVTYGGLETSVTILLRFFAIASAAALFAVTTDPERFEATLVWLKIPWKLAFIFSLTLRLVPDLKRRYQKIEEAQLSRGLSMEGGPIKRIRAKIPLVIPFLASVIRYGYDLTEALEARNFDSISKRTNMIRLEHRAYDYLLDGTSVAILLIFIYTHFFRAL